MNELIDYTLIENEILRSRQFYDFLKQYFLRFYFF